MTSESLPGICGEPTTYRNDYHSYKLPHKLSKLQAKKDEHRKEPKPKKTVQLYAESHDTFQKLNYNSRLPFNALWQPKEIVGDARQILHRKIQPELNDEAIPNRPKIEVVSPAVSLEDVKDPETRKLLLDFTYKTTTSRAADEVWRDFHKTAETSCKMIPNESSADPVSLKIKLMPDIPACFKRSAKKWDDLQDRTHADVPNVNRKKSNPMHTVEANENLLKRFKDQCILERAMIDERRLRLLYEKLHFSYGGHRTPIALGVPLEKKKISIYHPDLTVSQALTSRRN